MQAMRSGVREFLSQPIDPMVVREMLERLVKQRGMPHTETEKLVVVAGAKGGVGTTTVSVNLAVQLARSAGKRVVLFDLGRPLGHAALLLDLETRFSFRAAVESLDRLDSHLVQRITGESQERRAVACAELPKPMSGTGSPPCSLARVINVAQSSFDYVVADIGTSCSSEWAPVLRLARQVVLVTETNVPSLWSLERQMTLLRSLGIDSARLRLVVNRWHQAGRRSPAGFRETREAADFRAIAQRLQAGKPGRKYGRGACSGSKRSAGAEVSQHGGSDYRDPPRGGHRKARVLSWGCSRENNRIEG